MPPSLNRARFAPRPSAAAAPAADDAELWDLVDRARDGDAAAFSRFFDATVSSVFAYVCRRLLGDRDAAEEIVTDVYLGAWRGLRTVRRVASSPIAWLRTIAQRRVIDHHRSRQRRNVSPAGAPTDLATMRGATTVTGDTLDAPPAEAHCVDHDQARGLWSHAEQLSADQHRVLRYRFWLGWSLQDTATALGKPVAAVKSLQYRALKNLREQLGGTELDPRVAATLVAA